MNKNIAFIGLAILSSSVGVSAQSITNLLDNISQQQSVTYTYNELGLMLSMDGPRTDVQDITKYEYDAQGRLIKTINPLGHTTEILTYNSFNEPLSIKNENGVITTLTYNGFGWLEIITVNTRETHFEYDKTGQITKTILPDNSFIIYEYDDAHRLIAIEDNEGNRTTYQLDLMGNKLKTDIKNNVGTLTSTQQNVFDELSRLRTATNGVGDSTLYDYNKNDLLVKETDALTNVTQHSYDALNRLTQTIGADNGVTKLAYDNASQLSSVTDAESKTTEYKYTPLNNISTQISPDSGTTKYAYDNADNLVLKTDARGVTTKYTYDELSRLTKINYGSVKENVSLYYDDVSNNNKGIGKLTRVTDSSGQAEFVYDNYEQLTTERYQIKSPKSAVQHYETSYQYNDNGAITKITYPSGRQVIYSLNTLGLVNNISTQSISDTASTTVISNVNYLPFGPSASYTYGNGLVATRMYDKGYRLTGDNLAALKNQTITYSKIGNIKAIVDASDASNNQTLTYDKLSRLKTANGEYGSFEYTYDKIGNRLTKKENTLTDTYGYSPDNHHLNGITIQIAHPEIKHVSRYNLAGRLSHYTSGLGTTSYLYNHRGLRSAKTNAVEKVHYHYNVDGLLIAESTDSGAWNKEYVYFNNQLVAVVDYSHDANGSLFYVHTDYLGTPKLATNSAKALVWQADYTPFGIASINDDVDNDSITLTLNIRFPGQYYDKESKLHNNWFRYYDPVLGRYIKSDPIGLEAGVSTYGYVGANPLSRYDFYGLKECPEGMVPKGVPCEMAEDDGSLSTDGKCMTAECAAGLLPNREMTPAEKCMAMCLFEGHIGGKAVEKIADEQSKSFNEKACKNVIGNIKENKIANKVPYLNTIMGAAGTAACAKFCYSGRG